MQNRRKDEGRNLYSTRPRLGEIVIDAENVAKGYGDKLLFENLNFALPAGESLA